jgi:hypothetical protein
MAQYSFYIPSFHIQEIRSAHTDALFASTALKVMNPNGSLRRDYGAKGVGLGDRKAGGDVVPGLAWENVGRAGSDASESGRGCRLLDLCAGECQPYRRRVRFHTQSKAPQLLLLTLHETTPSRLRPPDRRHLFRAEDVFFQPGTWPVVRLLVCQAFVVSPFAHPAVPCQPELRRRAALASRTADPLTSKESWISCDFYRVRASATGVKQIPFAGDCNEL